MRQVIERFFCGAACTTEDIMKITVSIAKQELELFDDSGKSLRRYQVSTGANGAGEESGSFCTPRGRHIIRAKIGAGQSENAVFVKRRPTGEIYTAALGAQHKGRDWILTRILWLSGCESGYNRGGSCDTMRRYIYIHGTPDGTALGTPGSRGCVRMRNAELMELFELVKAGTEVEIAA
jgi:L,D-transpeptidase YbiS